MKPRRAKLALAALMVSLAGCAAPTTPLPQVDTPKPAKAGGGSRPAFGSDLSLFGAPLVFLGGMLNPAPANAPRYADIDNGDNGGAPILVGQREKLPMFGMDRPSGSLDFDYFYEHDRETQSGVPATSSTDNTSQETVTLKDHAYFIHPNLLDLTMSGTFGMQQETFDGAGQHQYTAGLLDAWDVNAALLRNQDMPITLFTQRSEQIITPDFSPSLDSINTNYGVGVGFLSHWAPSQLQVSHSDSTETEPGGLLDYSLAQDTVHWHTEVLGLPDHTLGFDYTFQNSQEQNQGGSATHYQDNNATLNDVYLFGPGKVDSLSSTANFSQEQGNRDYQDIRLDENLRIPYSKTFETHYEYSFDQNTVDDSTQTTNHVQAGFIHRLFQSLVTTGNIGGSLLDYAGSQVEQLDGTLDLNYRKKAWLGELFANLDLGYHWQYSPEGTDVVHVINQAQTFNDPQPLVLTTPNINAGTIRLFSASGVPYTLGRDYAVNQVGNLIQVQRVLGGLIASDSTVLMDYDLNPQPASTINTTSLGAGTRYTFDRGPLDGLSPYARYNTQNQQVDTPATTNAIVPNSFQLFAVGSDYKIWNFTFNGEQDWYQSTLVPYNSTQFSGRYDQAFAHDLTAELSASYQMLNYYGESDHVTNSAINATVRRRLNSDWSILARAAWVDDRDQLFGNSNGLEESLELNWRHRQTHVYLRLRNADLVTSGQRDDFQTLEIGVGRDF